MSPVGEGSSDDKKKLDDRISARDKFRIEVEKLNQENKLYIGLSKILKSLRKEHPEFSKINERLKNLKDSLAKTHERLLKDAIEANAYEIIDEILKLELKSKLLTQKQLTSLFKITLDKDRLVCMIRFFENGYLPFPEEMPDVLNQLFSRASPLLQRSFINYCNEINVQLNTDNITFPFTSENKELSGITKVTPLMRAVIFGDVEFIILLLKAGADPEQTIGDTSLMMYYAMNFNSIHSNLSDKAYDVFEEFLKADANLYHFDFYPAFLVILFAFEENERITDLVINNIKVQELIDSCSFHGYNPLGYESFLDRPDILLKFIKMGGKEMLEKWGNNALCMLIRELNPQEESHQKAISILLRELLTNGIYINEEYEGHTAMELAAMKGCIGIVASLKAVYIDHGSSDTYLQYYRNSIERGYIRPYQNYKFKENKDVSSDAVDLTNNYDKPKKPG